jgi:DNA-directed RNA polymerase subunit RPC12/RpoP
MNIVFYVVWASLSILWHQCIKMLAEKFSISAAIDVFQFIKPTFSENKKLDSKIYYKKWEVIMSNMEKGYRCPNCNEHLRDLNLKICPYCGIEILIQEGEVYLLIEKDVLEKNNFDPENIWIFTDPIAKAKFGFEKKLFELEQDIRFNVMRGVTWQEDDIQYLFEVKRLLRDGIIKKTTSYWFSSPFSTIYKALRNGKIFISGKKYMFRKGEEIVWQCQMGRELHNLGGPVLVGEFTPKRMTLYCKEMDNVMKGKRIMIRR